MRLLAVLVIVVLAVMAYIRLAPTKWDKWHQPVMSTGPGDYPEVGGFRAERKVAGNGQDVLSELQSIALATPRTRVLKGSPESGMITFVTRSRLMGFPDYTTAEVNGSTLRIYGRLRFGRSDLGVNRARIEGWLAQLGDKIEAP